MTNNGHDHDNDGCQTKVEKLDLQRTEYALFPSLIHQVTTINKTFSSFNQYLSWYIYDQYAVYIMHNCKIAHVSMIHCIIIIIIIIRRVSACTCTEAGSLWSEIATAIISSPQMWSWPKIGGLTQDHHQHHHHWHNFLREDLSVKFLGLDRQHHLQAMFLFLFAPPPPPLPPASQHNTTPQYN